MRQDVGRRSRSVAGCNKPFAYETLSEYSRQYVEEIKQTGNPGFDPRRRFCNPIHHYSCVHTDMLPTEMFCDGLLRRPMDFPYEEAVRKVSVRCRSSDHSQICVRLKEARV
jgi:hypothetical protein